jgi:flagellar basal body-associated protein FliL
MPSKTGKNYMRSKKSQKHEPSKMGYENKWSTPHYKLKIGGGAVDAAINFDTTTMIALIIVIVVIGIVVYIYYFGKKGFYMVKDSPIRSPVPNKTVINKDRPLINENHSVGCAFEKNNSACDPAREVFGENDTDNIRNAVDTEQAKKFIELQVPVKQMVEENNKFNISTDIGNDPLLGQIRSDLISGPTPLDNTIYDVSRNDIPSIVKNSGDPVIKTIMPPVKNYFTYPMPN